MPIHPWRRPQGTLVELTVDSTALAGNLLGDPSERTVAVYLPPGYPDSAGDYPLLVDLAAYTSSGLAHVAWRSFGDNLLQRVDRLVESGTMGPVVLAMPDSFTSLGGNQFVNTPVFGRWEDFLADELVPALEARFRIRPGREHRALFGKSSGGYGALVQAMRRPDAWGAVASHAGDVGFDLLYRGDIPKAVLALERHRGSVEAFVEHLDSQHRIGWPDMHTLMILAMAASYDPQPDAPLGVRLPADPRTARLDDEAWARWLRHDPLQMIERPEHQEALRGLRGLYIDAGRRDEYHIQLGTRALVDRLTELGIEHYHEEFDGGHTGIDWRLDTSLPWLYERID